MHARRRREGLSTPGRLTPLASPRTLVAPSMASAAAKKILIIEDEKDILQLVKLYLEKEGYRAVTAATGPKGWTARSSTNPTSSCSI